MRTWLRKRTGLLIIVLAAVLLEILSAAQYYSTHILMEEQLEKRAESELTLKAILIKSRLNSAEDDLKNHVWDICENLTHPDSAAQSIGRMIHLSRFLQGGAVAFVPDYYPTKGRLYEPYAQKSGDSIVKRQIGGPDHDYTTSVFYQQAIAANDALWIDPYEDTAGAQTSVISFTKPIYDKRQDLAGVVCVDVALNWLRDTIDRRHIYPSSFVMLLTEDGRPIIRPSESRISMEESDAIISLINDSTVAREKSSNGRTTKLYFDTDKRDGTIFYANLKGKPHWLLAVVCYDDEVYGPLKELRLRLLLLSLLAFGILLYMIYSFARNEKKLMKQTLEQERIGSELRIASEIQTQMLPRENSVTRDDVDIYGSLAPAREVGGDLFDFFIRDEKLFFCIGDVSGKGVPSAMLMAVTHSLFRSASAHENNPARIMQNINEACCHGNESSMFVTFFIGVLDLPTGRLRYCNAGHDKPILIVGHDLMPEDRKPNLPLGVFEDVKYMAYEWLVPPGSTLFLYTDGLTEAMNSQHKQFGLDRLHTVLQRGEEMPQALLQKVTDAVAGFVEEYEQSDDLTMLAIHYTPKVEKVVLDESLTLRNDSRQVAQLSTFVKDVTGRLPLNAKQAGEIRLAVEEAVVNVMEYAYPVGTEGDVTIEVKSDGQQVKFIISDTGVAFDPTEAAKADTTLSAEDRPIGGLGILLVRRLMDSINYERVDGRNILTLKKTIQNN